MSLPPKDDPSWQLHQPSEAEMLGLAAMLPQQPQTAEAFIEAIKAQAQTRAMKRAHLFHDSHKQTRSLSSLEEREAQIKQKDFPWR